MRSFLKFSIWLAALILLVGFYFSSNIRGYYRFKEICKKEGGLHVFQPLERNVGWTVRGNRVEDTAFPVLLEGVAFVRYEDTRDGKYGNFFDVYKTPKQKVGDPGYARKPANIENPVIYEYRSIQKSIENEIRMGETSDEFIDLRSSKLAANYRSFTYSKFDPKNTILAAPSGETCPDDILRTDPKTGRYFPLKREIAFTEIFAK